MPFAATRSASAPVEEIGLEARLASILMLETFGDDDKPLKTKKRGLQFSLTSQ